MSDGQYEVISIRLARETAALIKKIAAQEDRKPSAVGRRLILSALKSRSTMSGYFGGRMRGGQMTTRAARVGRMVDDTIGGRT